MADADVLMAERCTAGAGPDTGFGAGAWARAGACADADAGAWRLLTARVPAPEGGALVGTTAEGAAVARCTERPLEAGADRGTAGGRR
ncbi:hypothetical protein OHS59_23985 [Streptomyces sp. NBC_00414]|uniref:hypothetical protein n=1 Tax=Streptomyces sp. NBC_00414 TaxID=2975739 RepID=UPI002E21A866